MSGEISSSSMRETAETKNIEKPDNFKNIRPENGTTKEDVRDFLDRAFFGEKEENVPEAKAETAAEPEKNDDGEKGVPEPTEDGKSALEPKSDNVVDDTETKSETVAEDIKESKEFENYKNDLKSKSPCPETISDDVFDKSKWERRSTEEVALKKTEFKGVKARLISEWEKANGQEWPRYEEDVISEKGNVLRRAGDPLDVHHIQPISLGGENEVNNITPLHYDDHIGKGGVHGANGSCRQLQNKY